MDFRSVRAFADPQRRGGPIPVQSSSTTPGHGPAGVHRPRRAARAGCARPAHAGDFARCWVGSATGVAAAALPLGVLLWALSGPGRSVFAYVAAAVLLGVLAVTFAPWIPGVRYWLPTARRAAQLESFWALGHAITQQEIRNNEDLNRLGLRAVKWTDDAAGWIEGHISEVESERFREPGTIPFPDSRHLPAFDARRQHAVARIEAQLDVLIRLRDSQLRSLR